MGSNKALLPLGGITCIEHIALRLREACRDVIIVSDESEPYAFLSLPVIPDIVKESGPLAGICSALSAMKTGSALVVSCDLPLVAVALLRMLCELGGGDEDAVIPVSEGGRIQPLCGIYRRSCLGALERDLASGQRSVVAWLERCRVRYVSVASLLTREVDSGLLLNMNTPEDYRRISRLHFG